MTRQEAAIVAAYTGKMLGNFTDYHQYIEKLLGRPVFTHEIPSLMEDIKTAAKQDFINLEVV